MTDYTEAFGLGDAGEAVVGFSAQGVRLVDVTVAPAWEVAQRTPSGLFAKRRPADAVRVVLRRGGDEAELEIGRLDDGRWEIAQRRFTAAAPLGLVDVDAGTARLDWDGQRLDLGDVEAAPGWAVDRVEGPHNEDGAGSLVVIWRRSADQEVELVVDCGPDHPRGTGSLDVDRRERRAIS